MEYTQLTEKEVSDYKNEINKIKEKIISHEDYIAGLYYTINQLKKRRLEINNILDNDAFFKNIKNGIDNDKIFSVKKKNKPHKRNDGE